MNEVSKPQQKYRLDHNFILLMFPRFVSLPIRVPKHLYSQDLELTPIPDKMGMERNRCQLVVFFKQYRSGYTVLEQKCL